MAISNKGTGIERVVLSRVEFASRSFAPRRRVMLDRFIRDGLHYYENRDLNICVFAETPQELERELAERIAVLWDEYALEADDKLAPAALRLKKTLLDLLEVTGDAPSPTKG